ncbi:TonB-dependent siderophore receptor [Spirosoma flavus]
MGTVSDASGKPIPFATVGLIGTRYATQTTEDGRFTLAAPTKTYTLLVSAVGFETVRQAVTLKSGENTTLNLSLGEMTSSLDEVIVSASRRQETLAETPASVNVINSRDVQLQSGISPNIGNVLAYSVPGLALSTNQTSTFGQTLRGRNVLVLIDGIPQSTPLRAGSRDIRTIDPSVIERVEVIKGATSIYGNGADGGLINYITKKPVAGKTFGGATSIGMTGNLFHLNNSIGSRFTQQFYGKVGQLDYVVSGLYDKTGVFYDAKGEVISPEYGLGETKQYQGFVKLGYDLNFGSRQGRDRIEAMYNYYSSNQHSNYVLQAGKYPTTPAIGVLGTRIGVDEGNRFNHNAYVTYRSRDLIGGTDLEVNLYMQKFETVYSNSTSFFGSGQSKINSDKKGVRLNLTTPFSAGNVLIGDVTYGFDLLNDVTSQYLVDGRLWVPDMNMNNKAPYAQANTTIGQHLIAKGGVRYENIQVNVSDYTTLATGADGKGSVAVKGGNLNYNALVFNAGLRYTKFKAFNPFVSYSQAFSIYDLGRVLRAATQNTISLLQTEPIIVNNYEVGFSSRRGIAEFSAAYYLSTSKLGSSLVANANGIFTPQRLPERVQGVEFSLDLNLLRNLTLGGNYAYIEGKVDSNNDGQFDGDADTYLNTTRIAPPKTTASLRYSPIKSVNLGLFWIHSGNRDRFKPQANGAYLSGEGPIHAFDLVNLSAGWQTTKSTRLNLGVENLLNESYYPVVSQFYAANATYTRGNGARFNLSFTYSY